MMQFKQPVIELTEFYIYSDNIRSRGSKPTKLMAGYKLIPKIVPTDWMMKGQVSSEYSWMNTVKTFTRHNKSKELIKLVNFKCSF